MIAESIYVSIFYAMSCGIAVIASLKTASIVRLVNSRSLKLFWASFTLTCMLVELAHGTFAIYLASVPYRRDTAISGFILFAASIFFVFLANLIHASIMDAQQLPILKQFAYQDPLTGASNRRSFDKTISEAAHWPHVAVIFFDIDHFKAVNDTEGHDVGDLVLKHVARIISGAARGYPLYRTGGEEFAILASINSANASSLAESCRYSVERTPMVHTGQKLPITVSIGVAVSTANETMASLLRRADQALYFSKRSGRNRVSAAA